MRALDLFAGPGGWEEGAADLEIEILGIEHETVVCETRDAAGHPTLQGDVAALDPLDFGPIDLLIASPPCQAWSAAGDRGGQHDLAQVYALTAEVARGYGAPAALDRAQDWKDARSALVVEPLRWALALRPRYIALEQVPPVLDFWRHLAEILRAQGYGVWAGILEAERYGVPQTRERAILMAELGGHPHPPEPTHQRYVPGEPAQHQPGDLFGGEILPWVSMAEALGWGMNARPYPVVACSSETGGPDMEKVGGSGARRQLYTEQREGRWVVANTAGEGSLGGNVPRSDQNPAPTVTQKAGDWPILVNTGRDWKEGGSREDAQTFDADAQPAPAVDGKGRWHVVTPNPLNDEDWPESRPATTIAGDPRIFTPGGHTANDGRDNSRMRGRPEAAIRVSETEAAILQGFRPDYPWQGNKSARFRQIGNAFPPPCARAVLEALL